MNFNIGNPAACRAALYVRLSREDEREGASQSIENQISMLKDFCSENRLLIHKIYTDDGFTGTSFDCPDFSRMIQDIESQRVNMVITKVLSRLSRDYIMAGHYIERYFPEHQVRYISLLDGIDTGTDSSTNDLAPFRAVMNDMYAKDISKKILSVKHNNQKNGLFIGGKPPYGYKAHPDGKYKFVIDENAAPTVRRIFSMALDGTSCRQIASILNRERVPSPSVYAGVKVGRKGPYTGLWSSERISAMLQNEVYIGNMVQGRFVSVGYKSKKYRKLPRDQWTVVPHTHEPIIDRDTFESVGRLIHSRNRSGCRSYDYPLKGLIFCHECGYPLGVINSPRADKKDNLHFICRTYQRFSKSGACTCHYSPVDEVTEAVVDTVKDVCSRYLSASFLASEAEKVLNNVIANDSAEKEIRKLESKYRSLIAKMDSEYSRRLHGNLDAAAFAQRYADMKKQRDQIGQQIREQKSAQKACPAAPADPLQLARKFIESVPYNREFLTKLIERVELSEEWEIYITFRIKEINEG